MNGLKGFDQTSVYICGLWKLRELITVDAWCGHRALWTDGLLVLCCYSFLLKIRLISTQGVGYSVARLDEIMFGDVRHGSSPFDALHNVSRAFRFCRRC